MKTQTYSVRTAIATAVLFGAAAGTSLTIAGCGMSTCRPCAPRSGKRNPCSPNPCAARNPCAAGDRVDPKAVTRPAGTKSYQGDSMVLLNEGRELWYNVSISKNSSMSCATCHQDGNAMFHRDFAKPYPHYVQMAKDVAGMDSITLEGMVQLCMIRPMQSTPFAWDSRQLAALTAYTSVLQKKFNPCAAMNPCAAKNPCAPRNPCSMRNPCATSR